jgi:hypothetical protein
MSIPIDYAAIRALVSAAKRSGTATSDGSDPEPVKEADAHLPEPINPELPDWLLKSMHATREASPEWGKR